MQQSINDHLTPQTRTILNHLQTKGDISPLEAQGLYRCRSLSRRICDLKEMGYPVITEHKRDATGQRYARYVLLP